MEEDSFLGTQGGRGHDARGLLEKKRAEAAAVAKAIRRQFYQSDRVKTFNSRLLLTEILKAREEQMEIKHQKEIAAQEETKKLMAAIRQRELEAVEQEREKARRKERERAVIFEGLRQQLRNLDITRNLELAKKQKEVEECQRWRERYEREKAEQRRREQEEKVSARKAHEFLVSTRDAIRAREAQRLAAEEERRRQTDEEKERRARRAEEEAAKRRRRFQRHKQNLSDHLAAQQREKVGQEEERDARASTLDNNRHNDELERKRQEAEKNKATFRAIAAVREERRRAREQRAEEEERISRETLRANQEADRIYWEGQELEQQKKKEERFLMDDILRRQMAERAAKAQLSRSELVDIGRKNEELLVEEEQQFQEYAAEATEEAAKNNRHTCALRKATRQTIVSGLGPYTGGIRAGYLISNSSSRSRVPNYMNTPNEDIKKLYASTRTQDHRKLDFIW